MEFALMENTIDAKNIKELYGVNFEVTYLGLLADMHQNMMIHSFNSFEFVDQIKQFQILE